MRKSLAPRVQLQRSKPRARSKERAVDIRDDEMDSVEAEPPLPIADQLPSSSTSHRLI